MRFLLSDEQRQFATIVDGMLADADVPSVIRRWAAGDVAPGHELWSRLAATGITTLLSDGTPIDLTVIFEQMGRHAVPGPLVESVAVAPIVLADTELGEVWLPKLAAGSMATVAFPPEVPYALDADVADLVLLVESGMVGVARAGSGKTSVDRARRLFEVSGIGSGESVTTTERAWNYGTLCCAAQLLGLGGAMVDMAVDYAKTRIQFGRPIGQFQAVKHALADVLVGLELARPLLHGAAVALAEGSATVDRDVSAARVACGEAAYQAARTALQVHGAVGYTAEHDLSLFLTKVRALYNAWGTPATHRARVMEALC